MTPRTLINSALRAINAIGATETPTNDMFDDARVLFNMILDSWSAEELLPHDYVQKSFDLVSGQVNYTIVDGAAADADGIATAQAVSGASNLTLTGGALYDSTLGYCTMDVPRHVSITSTGNDADSVFTVTGTNTYGDTITEVIGNGTNGPNISTIYGTKQFKTVTQIAVDATTAGNISAGSGTIIDIRRPLKIVSAFCRTSAGADTPVLIASRERYNEIADKDESGTPTKLYYDRLYPSGEMYVHPVPAVDTLDMHLDLWLPFVTIDADDIDTDINLPSEYLLAFRWNLAAELAPEYGKNVTQFVFNRAMETRDIIRQLNAMPPKPMSMRSPAAIVNQQPASNQN
jgi:hypothetical protein